jgi:hypothetical protein
MPRAVFCDDSESGLGFKIGHRQQKCWRKPGLQSIANPTLGALQSVMLTSKPSEE